MSEYQSKLDYHKKTIGKRVYVLTRRNYWCGEVKDVVGEEGFLIQPDDLNEHPREISIFDVRYID